MAPKTRPVADVSACLPTQETRSGKPTENVEEKSVDGKHPAAKRQSSHPVGLPKDGGICKPNSSGKSAASPTARSVSLNHSTASSTPKASTGVRSLSISQSVGVAGSRPKDQQRTKPPLRPRRAPPPLPPVQQQKCETSPPLRPNQPLRKCSGPPLRGHAAVSNLNNATQGDASQSHPRPNASQGHVRPTAISSSRTTPRSVKSTSLERIVRNTEGRHTHECLHNNVDTPKPRSASLSKVRPPAPHQQDKAWANHGGVGSVHEADKPQTKKPSVNSSVGSHGAPSRPVRKVVCGVPRCGPQNASSGVKGKSIMASSAQRKTPVGLDSCSKSGTHSWPAPSTEATQLAVGEQETASRRGAEEGANLSDFRDGGVAKETSPLTSLLSHSANAYPDLTSPPPLKDDSNIASTTQPCPSPVSLDTIPSVSATPCEPIETDLASDADVCRRPVPRLSRGEESDSETEENPTKDGPPSSSRLEVELDGRTTSPIPPADVSRSEDVRHLRKKRAQHTAENPDTVASNTYSTISSSARPVSASVPITSNSDDVTECNRRNASPSSVMSNSVSPRPKSPLRRSLDMLTGVASSVASGLSSVVFGQPSNNSTSSPSHSLSSPRSLPQISHTVGCGPPPKELASNNLSLSDSDAQENDKPKRLSYPCNFKTPSKSVASPPTPISCQGAYRGSPGCPDASWPMTNPMSQCSGISSMSGTNFATPPTPSPILSPISQQLFSTHSADLSNSHNGTPVKVSGDMFSPYQCSPRTGTEDPDGDFLDALAKNPLPGRLMPTPPRGTYDKSNNSDSRRGATLRSFTDHNTLSPDAWKQDVGCTGRASNASVESCNEGRRSITVNNGTGRLSASSATDDVVGGDGAFRSDEINASPERPRGRLSHRESHRSSMCSNASSRRHSEPRIVNETGLAMLDDAYYTINHGVLDDDAIWRVGALRRLCNTLYIPIEGDRYDLLDRLCVWNRDPRVSQRASTCKGVIQPLSPTAFHEQTLQTSNTCNFHNLPLSKTSVPKRWKSVLRRVPPHKRRLSILSTRSVTSRAVCSSLVHRHGKLLTQQLSRRSVQAQQQGRSSIGSTGRASIGSGGRPSVGSTGRASLGSIGRDGDGQEPSTTSKIKKGKKGLRKGNITFSPYNKVATFTLSSDERNDKRCAMYDVVSITEDIVDPTIELVGDHNWHLARKNLSRNMRAMKPEHGETHNDERETLSGESEMRKGESYSRSYRNSHSLLSEESESASPTVIGEEKMSGEGGDGDKGDSSTRSDGLRLDFTQTQTQRTAHERSSHEGEVNSVRGGSGIQPGDMNEGYMSDKAGTPSGATSMLMRQEECGAGAHTGRVDTPPGLGSIDESASPTGTYADGDEAGANGEPHNTYHQVQTHTHAQQPHHRIHPPTPPRSFKDRHDRAKGRVRRTYDDRHESEMGDIMEVDESATDDILNIDVNEAHIHVDDILLKEEPTDDYSVACAEHLVTPDLNCPLPSALQGEEEDTCSDDKVVAARAGSNEVSPCDDWGKEGTNRVEVKEEEERTVCVRDGGEREDDDIQRESPVDCGVPGRTRRLAARGSSREGKSEKPHTSKARGRHAVVTEGSEARTGGDEERAARDDDKKETDQEMREPHEDETQADKGEEKSSSYKKGRSNRHREARGSKKMMKQGEGSCSLSLSPPPGASSDRGPHLFKAESIGASSLSPDTVAWTKQSNSGEEMKWGSFSDDNMKGDPQAHEADTDSPPRENEKKSASGRGASTRKKGQSVKAKKSRGKKDLQVDNQHSGETHHESCAEVCEEESSVPHKKSGVEEHTRGETNGVKREGGDGVKTEEGEVRGVKCDTPLGASARQLRSSRRQRGKTEDEKEKTEERGKEDKETEDNIVMHRHSSKRHTSEDENSEGEPHQQVTSVRPKSTRSKKLTSTKDCIGNAEKENECAAIEKEKESMTLPAEQCEDKGSESQGGGRKGRRKQTKAKKKEKGKLKGGKKSGGVDNDSHDESMTDHHEEITSSPQDIVSAMALTPKCKGAASEEALLNSSSGSAPSPSTEESTSPAASATHAGDYTRRGTRRNGQKARGASQKTKSSTPR